MVAASPDACCSHALIARHLAEELELALARVKELEALLSDREPDHNEQPDHVRGHYPWR